MMKAPFIVLSVGNLQKRARVLLLALVATFATMASSVSADLFEAYEYKLDNGLELVVLPNRLSPIVHHMLFYKAGAKDEIPGRSGVAHYLEHLMFKGTDTRADGEFSALVAKNGGQENAFTSHDYTGYFQTVSKENLELMMELEADRMQNLKLEQSMIDAELAVVQEERRQRTDNNPSGILSEESRASRFTNHPYGRPIIGWMHEVETLKLADVLDFYNKWYAPNNAVLVVGGDVEPEAVLAMAQKHYGVVPAKELPPRLNLFEAKPRVDKTLDYSDPRVGLPSYAISYFAPARRVDERMFGHLGLSNKKAASALQVFDEAFGSGSTAPLYKKLVIEDKIAAGVGSFYSGSLSDYGTFGFFVAPNAGEPLEPAIDALNQEIVSLLETGMDPELVKTAKRRLIRSAVLARDDLKTAPQLVGSTIAGGGTLDDVQSWSDRIEAVTVDQINQVIRAIVNKDAAVINIIRPQIQPEGQLETQQTAKGN